MMNQQQVKYARHRAEGILLEKRKLIEAKYTDQGHTMSFEERIAALKAGEFTVTGDCKSSHQWSYHIKFNADRPRVVDYDAMKPEIDALNKVFQSLLDELVLGDNEEALRLLKAFESE